MNRKVIVSAVVGLASVTLLCAADSAEPAPVYTNADLLKYGPPSPPAPPAVEEDPGWEFVVAFIERERARIDAERTHEIDRQAVALAEAEAEAARDARVYSIGYGYGYGYGYGAYADDRHHGSRDHRPNGDRHGVHAPILRPSAGIVPLHARPSDAMKMRARATLRSGVDAFPSNSRRAH